jgi:hypothetical protein
LACSFHVPSRRSGVFMCSLACGLRSTLLKLARNFRVEEEEEEGSAFWRIMEEKDDGSAFRGEHSGASDDDDDDIVKDKGSLRTDYQQQAPARAVREGGGREGGGRDDDEFSEYGEREEGANAGGCISLNQYLAVLRKKRLMPKVISNLSVETQPQSFTPKLLTLNPQPTCPNPKPAAFDLKCKP